MLSNACSPPPPLPPRMLRPWLDARGYCAPGRGAAHSHHFIEKGGGKFLIPAEAAEEFHAILAADLAAGVRHCVSEAHTVPAFRLALDLDCRSAQPLPPGELLQLCAAAHLAVRAFYFGTCCGSGASCSGCECSRPGSGACDSESRATGSSASSSMEGSMRSGSAAGSSASEPTVLALNTASPRPQKDGTLLTGAHLIFPGIVTNSATALACRTAVVAALGALPAARRLCNGLEAAVDAGVLLEQAGLRLVGTYKFPCEAGVYLPAYLLHPSSHHDGSGSAGDLAGAAAAAAAAAQPVEVAMHDADALAAWMQRTSLRVHGGSGQLTRAAVNPADS